MYTLEFWHTVRSLYESGQFSSATELRKHVKGAFGTAPSKSSIEKRMNAENWDKNRFVPAIQQKIEENVEDVFARLGMPKEERIRKIVEGINHTQEIMRSVEEAVRSNGGELDPDIIKKIAALANDYRVALEYLREANKMSGSYPAIEKKIDHTTKGQKLIPRTVLSPEEIDSRIKSAFARFQRTGAL